MLVMYEHVQQKLHLQYIQYRTSSPRVVSAGADLGFREGGVGVEIGARAKRAL